MRRILQSLLLIWLPFTFGCREPDRPSAPLESAGLAVDSDPRGATIFLNGANTGAITPDTLRDLTVDRHRLDLVLDSAGYDYGAGGTIQTNEDEITSVFVPLLLDCLAAPCATAYHAPNRIQFAVSADGPLLLVDGNGEGALWPASTGNSYVSTATPVITAIQRSTGDTLALGPYDHLYLGGRPAPRLEAGADFLLSQEAWILPLADVRTLSTIRGIQIEERVASAPVAEDALVLELTFRNITDQLAYRTVDPLAEGGITFDDVFVGLALDGDVGTSTDDMVSYDPDLDMAILYDGDFRESGFANGWADRPGLVGLRVLEAPAGTEVRLNAWPRDLDWQADGLRALVSAPAQPERTGWGWLSATQTVLPNHAHPRIGYTPGAASDYRVSVAAGPLTLAPGEASTITVAIVLAEPAPGTFTPGVALPPGDPTDTTRPLHAVAAGLRAQAQAAEGVLDGG